MKQSHEHGLYQTLGDMRQSEIGICIFGFQTKGLACRIGKKDITETIR